MPLHLVENVSCITFIGIPEFQIFLMKIFSVYSRIEPWHKIPIRVFILGLLGYAAFYEDKTYYGVCPYADQHGNFSFIVRVKVN